MILLEVIKINNTILEFNKILYVDSIHGNDETGDGSKCNPYKTLQIAIDRSDEGNAIKLSEGIYDIRGFNNLLEKDNVTYIGSNKTIVEIKANNTLIKNPKALFYAIIFRPSQNYINEGWVDVGVKSLLHGGDEIQRIWDLTFYNCVFEDPFNQLTKNERHSCYIMADGSSSFEHTYKNLNFINCVALDTPIVTTWADNNVKEIKVQNCATNIASLINPTDSIEHSNNVEVLTSLVSVSFDGEYKIISEGRENMGIGANPDGTQAHIGVYGGEFAWKEFMSFILFKKDNTIYYFNGIDFIESDIIEPLSEHKFKMYGINDNDVYWINQEQWSQLGNNFEILTWTDRSDIINKQIQGNEVDTEKGKMFQVELDDFIKIENVDIT